MNLLTEKTKITFGKRPSFTELFYDLIFVFCVSSCLELAGESADGTLALYSWAVFLFCFLCSLQIWVFTTFLLNRYGNDKTPDHIGQFSSMFLMYFMINSMSCEWGDYMMFNVSWIIVLGIIAAMWLYKLKTVEGLSASDTRQIKVVVVFLLVQMAIVGISCTMSGDLSMQAQFMCLGSIIWSLLGLFLTQLCHPSHCDFEHLVERCGILVILVLGEVIIGISGAMTSIGQGLYCILLFCLAVCIFLVYFSHAEEMVNSHSKSTGLAYLAVNLVIITMIAHCAIGLHLLVNKEISTEFGLLFLGGSLCIMLMAMLFNMHWSKPQLRACTGRLVLGRLIACAVIMASVTLMPDHPHIDLFIQILIVMAVVLQIKYHLHKADHEQ